MKIILLITFLIAASAFFAFSQTVNQSPVPQNAVGNKKANEIKSQEIATRVTTFWLPLV
jgi:hypothetical protein